MERCLHEIYLAKDVDYDEVRWADFDSIKVASLTLDEQGQFIIKNVFGKYQLTPGQRVNSETSKTLGFSTDILFYTMYADYGFTNWVYNNIYGDIVKKYQWAE